MIDAKTPHGEPQGNRVTENELHKDSDFQRVEQEKTAESLSEIGWCFIEACRRGREIEKQNDDYTTKNAELLERLNQPFRIGDDLYEFIQTPRADGRVETMLMRRTRQNIRERYPDKGFIESTLYFHDVTNIPNNVSYKQVVRDCLNLYPKPLHKVSLEVIRKLNEKPEMIATWLILLKHIFGKQLQLGIQYLAVAVQHPDWLLPILCLTSRENSTGKSTFATALGYLFGSSVALLGNADLQSTFNHFAKYLFAVFEEVSSTKGSRDKLKAISTATRATINEKFVAQRVIDVSCHIIINSNEVNDFVTANQFDIRYWILRLQPLKEWIPDFAQRLREESETFFNFLATYPLPKPQSRMFFAVEDLHTSALDAVRESSLSDCAKDLKVFVGEKIADIGHFFATIGELADESVLRRYTPSQISKALRDELGYKANRQMRYTNLNGICRNGKPFEFGGEDYLCPNSDDLPF